MSQSPTQILELLERHGLSPRKAYGQHYLADANLIAKVVSLAGVTGADSVVEVGAGTGALTVALAGTGARVDGLGVDLRFADIMDVDLSSDLGRGPWKLVANLPYNVGTPLLLDVLQNVAVVSSLTVMVQKEVADRLVAAPGSPEYGLPSVVVSLTAKIGGRFSVPPQVFVPPPQVASAVVHLDRVEAPNLIVPALDLARKAFGQRRKMLRRSLGDLVAMEVFDAAGIDPASRPEELAPEQFVSLAEHWSAHA